MQTLRLLLLFSLLAMAPAGARAESARGFYAGGGFFSANLAKIAAGESGSRSIIGDVYFPEISLGYRFGAWFPLFGYSLFGKSFPESTKRRGILRLQVPYVFSRDDSPWEWKAGLGCLIHRIYGDGGATDLANGSNRQTYYVPGEGSNARILYAVGGAGYQAGRLRYDLDLMFSGVLSTRRAFHLAAGAGYVF
ncbi:MAG: hypothetical protein EOP11_06715 [Proteobacteria bacterium]|nr:MAG: hypothetical protein EOP11_06715 [Pseudomonadota bacterium]